MRKWLRLGLCLGLLAVALTCTALAADDKYTTSLNGGTVTYNKDTDEYTASYTGAVKGYQYALLVVKGTEASHPISDDTIMYIDQTAANENGEVSFTFIPKSTPDCVVLLGGDFGEDGPSSPVTLGTLIGQGVTVSGTVKFQESSLGATVTLYNSQGTEIQSVTTGTDGRYSFDSVPVDEGYKLVVTKAGYCSYTITNISIEEEGALKEIDVQSVAGDVNGNGEINVYDLTELLGEFNHTDTEIQNKNTDINQNGVVNVYDLTYLLSNFNNGNIEETWTE